MQRGDERFTPRSFATSSSRSLVSFEPTVLSFRSARGRVTMAVLVRRRIERRDHQHFFSQSLFPCHTIDPRARTLSVEERKT